MQTHTHTTDTHTTDTPTHTHIHTHDYLQCSTYIPSIQATYSDTIPLCLSVENLYQYYLQNTPYSALCAYIINILCIM